MDYQRRSLKPTTVTGTDGETRKSRVSRASRATKLSRESRLSNYDSSKYGIDIYELEGLMDLYKERGEEYQDLIKIENLQGTGGIIAKLDTNQAIGIKSTEVTDRIKGYGSNRVFEEPPATFCSFVLEALGDLMIMILCISAVIQIVLGMALGKNPSTDWIDGASVIIAVLIVVTSESFTFILYSPPLNNSEDNQIFLYIHPVQELHKSYHVLPLNTDILFYKLMDQWHFYSVLNLYHTPIN